jgi:predicted  nucleic acid-binding Zn-ribbon protein
MTTNPKTIIDRLRELTALECKAEALSEHGVDVSKSLAAEIEAARALIPTAILGHHDRMRARGRKSLAPVRNGVCGACHLRLPISHAISLNPNQDIEVCDNCGAFLYVEVATEPVSPLASTPAKRTATKRTTKAKKATVQSSMSEHLSISPE